MEEAGRSPGAGDMAMDQSSLEAVVMRLEQAVSRLEGLGSRATSMSPDQGISSLVGQPGAGAGAPPAAVEAFDQLVQTRVGRVLAAADKIGGSVLQTSQVLQRAFEAEKAIVLAISQCKVGGVVFPCGSASGGTEREREREMARACRLLMESDVLGTMQDL